MKLQSISAIPLRRNSITSATKYTNTINFGNNKTSKTDNCIVLSPKFDDETIQRGYGYLATYINIISTINERYCQKTFKKLKEEGKRVEIYGAYQTSICCITDKNSEIMTVKFVREHRPFDEKPCINDVEAIISKNYDGTYDMYKYHYGILENGILEVYKNISKKTKKDFDTTYPDYKEYFKFNKHEELIEHEQKQGLLDKLKQFLGKV